MSKHGLYPTLSRKGSVDNIKLLMNLISLCDGVNSLLEIAEYLNVPIWSLYELVDTLANHELLEEVVEF
jgi:aminopeptidase-like protein